MIAVLLAARFLGRVQSGVDDVVGEIEKAVPTREKPMPVVIQGEQKSLLTRVTAWMEPLASVGLVALLVVFMLFERVEMRNRVIRLVGYGRLTLTTLKPSTRRPGASADTCSASRS